MIWDYSTHDLCLYRRDVTGKVTLENKLWVLSPTDGLVPCDLTCHIDALRSQAIWSTFHLGGKP